MTKYAFFTLLCCTLLSACGSEGEPTLSSNPSTTTTEAAKAAEQKKTGDSAEQAPAEFTVKLETTKGDILIDVTRAWAPKGADRFHTLVQTGYYDNVAFFRVVKGFMAQVGISGDPALNKKWRAMRIADDPVTQSNTRGMISFAMAGPNTRTTQIFINYDDNVRLDKMGFAPFGKVRDMGAVDALYGDYGEGAPRGKGPHQGRLQAEGNAYLKSAFPALDYIKTARVME